MVGPGAYIQGILSSSRGRGAKICAQIPVWNNCHTLLN